jgi:hypothetical protein
MGSDRQGGQAIVTPRRSLLVWAAAVVVLLAYIVAASGPRMTHGFIAYYVAARLLAAGQLGQLVYDDAWFMRVVQEMTGSGVLEVYGPNPPAMALAALPVAWADPAIARWIWLLASLAAFAATTYAWLRLGPSGVAAPAPLVAIVMLAPPVWANLRTGQIYLFVFAAVAVTARAVIGRRDRVAGLMLGLALALKSAGAAWVSLLLAERRFLIAAAAIVVAAALNGAVLLVTGAGIGERYPAYVQEFVTRPAASVTAYQTTWGFVRHLCVADPQWNPAPAAECEAVATFLPPVAVAVAFLVTVAVVRGAAPALGAAAGICLSLIAVPVAGDHHFVVLGLVMLLLWQHGAGRADRHGRPGRAVWFVASALYLVPMEATAFRFTDGWWAVAAYPRLYLVWLLWGVIVGTAWRERRATR